MPVSEPQPDKVRRSADGDSEPSSSAAGGRRYAIPEIAALILLGGLFSILLGQIVARALGTSLVWVEEMSIVGFTWLIFLGAGIAFRRSEELVIDLSLRRLDRCENQRVATVWRLVLIAMSISFFVILAIGLALMAVQMWSIPAGSVPAFKIGYLYFGAFVTCLVSLEALVRRFVVLLARAHRAGAASQ